VSWWDKGVIEGGDQTIRLYASDIRGGKPNELT